MKAKYFNRNWYLLHLLSNYWRNFLNFEQECAKSVAILTVEEPRESLPVLLGRTSSGDLGREFHPCGGVCVSAGACASIYCSLIKTVSPLFVCWWVELDAKTDTSAEQTSKRG